MKTIKILHLSTLSILISGIILPSAESSKAGPWTELAKKYGLSTTEKSGYIFFRDKQALSILENGAKTELKKNAMFQGYQNPKTGKLVYEPKNPRHWIQPDDLKYMVKLYKIHLMPKDGDEITTVNKLLDAVKKDNELKKHILYIKAYTTIPMPKEAQEQDLPAIVIYTTEGKSGTQDVLDRLYTVFKGQEGSNRKPRYNQKVNSLLWVTPVSYTHLKVFARKKKS